MKKILYIMLFLFSGISMVISRTINLDPPNMPEKSFQATSSGIAIALELKSRMEKNLKIPFIRLYLRNTTNSDVGFYPYALGSKIEFYYILKNGEQVSLRDYQYPATANSTVGPIIIGPGHTLEKDITLTENEWKIMQAYPVACSCFVFGAGTKPIKVVSIPQLLKEGS